MTPAEKINKVSENFSLLNEEKQDYVLGILEALVFANSPPPDGTAESAARSGNAPDEA